MEFEEQFTTIDTHTAGEPLRIITGGFPQIPGKIMQDKHDYLEKEWDDIREKLMHEPRGHQGMYGCVVTPPVSDGADFGVLFMHTDGFSAMCGHGMIAVVTALAETGYFKHQKDRFIIDTVAGTIVARGRYEDSEVHSVSFENVPCFVYDTDLPIWIHGKKVPVDIAYGGAFYAIVRAQDAGTGISIDELSVLKELGAEIKQEVEKEVNIQHPLEKKGAGISGVIFFEEPKNSQADLRTVTVFGDKQIDRSPGGTATCAHLALRHHHGLLKPKERFVTEGIAEGQLTGQILQETQVGPYRAVIPEIEGSAFVTGFHRFVFDSTDPLKHGFLLK